LTGTVALMVVLCNWQGSPERGLKAGGVLSRENRRNGSDDELCAVLVEIVNEDWLARKVKKKRVFLAFLRH